MSAIESRVSLLAGASARPASQYNADSEPSHGTGEISHGCARRLERHLEVAAGPIIRRVARRLRWHPAFRHLDEDDLNHDLWIAFIAKAPHFDPAKGSAAAFCQIVVSRFAASMIKTESAQMRDYRRVLVSYEELATTAPSTYRGTTPSEDAHHLRIDVARQAARLRPRERLLCELVQSSTISEAARAIGVTRSTASEILSTKVRAHFIKAGLAKHVK